MEIMIIFFFYAFNMQLQSIYPTTAEWNKTKFVRFLPLEDKNITRYFVLKSKSDSAPKCASSCASLDTCESFFYNTASGECQHQAVVFPTTIGAKDQKGIKYYYAVNGWCSAKKGFQLLTEDGPCVKFHTEGKSWYKANQTCVSYSPYSRLVVLDSQEKNEMVKAAAMAINDQFTRPHWIGLSEKPQLEDEYEWVDGGNVVFSDWSSYSGSSPDTHDCACLLRDMELKWSAHACYQIKHYICENVNPWSDEIHDKL